VDWKVSGVPQPEQKVRTPRVEDRKLEGLPEVIRNAVSGTVNQVTNAAPLVRRQMEQWQFVSSDGEARTS
jgi:hypothetical protein